MIGTVRKMNSEQLTELNILDEQMGVIQSELDALDIELQRAEEVVNEVRDRIRAKRPLLVPLAEMKLKVVRS